MSDPIERRDALDALNRCTDVYYTNLPPLVDKEEVRRALASLPSAEPELNFDEWCTDCKEYDHERHCCPRFNRVIRNALKDAQLEIIRCKDCKHSEFWYRDKRRCFLWHKEGIDVFEDGFCNYAERRIDEQT